MSMEACIISEKSVARARSPKTLKLVARSVKSAEAMPPGFDNDEGPGQFGFSMGLEDPFQFIVRGLQCGWGNTQVNDATAQVPNEDQTAEIFIAGYEKPLLLTRAVQQISVRCPREAKFSGGCDIVAEVAEETGGQRVNVLIEQESHEAALKWMSSV